ncbi:MAG: hypothetical protein DRI90_06450 [Deltaproteobacteria bacterium]|nr:MAG: hypothetical protein DRI90_06450 [Deltaproteobacteria bacterium]
MSDQPTPTRDPTSGGTTTEVVRLAYPVVLSMLAHTVMGLVDTLFMGWVSTDAQAAVGLGSIVAWSFASLFTGTISAVNTFVAQHYGAGQLSRCGKAAWHGLALAAIGSVILVTVGAPLVSRMVQLFGADAAVGTIAASYSFIRVAGGPVICFEMALNSFMRGIGDTRTPMKVAIGMMVLNVPLNYLLVFGGLGLQGTGPDGAAYATVIAGGLGVAVLFALFLRRRWREELGTGWPGGLQLSEIYALLRVGLPIGIHWMLEMVTWTVFTVIVARFGAVSLAAHNIVLQVLHLSFMPGVAISIAATTLVGQGLGAADKAAARRAAISSLGVAVLFMTLMGGCFLLASGWIGEQFSTDVRVVELVGQLFVYAACFQIFDALGMVSGGVLRGAGITRFPMAVSLACAAVLFGPLVWLFAFRLDGGVVGAWAAMTVTICVLGTILALRVRGRSWLDVDLVVGH